MARSLHPMTQSVQPWTLDVKNPTQPSHQVQILGSYCRFMHGCHLAMWWRKRKELAKKTTWTLTPPALDQTMHGHMLCKRFMDGYIIPPPAGEHPGSHSGVSFCACAFAEAERQSPTRQPTLRLVPARELEKDKPESTTWAVRTHAASVPRDRIGDSEGLHDQGLHLPAHGEMVHSWSAVCWNMVCAFQLIWSDPMLQDSCTREWIVRVQKPASSDTVVMMVRWRLGKGHWIIRE